MSLRDCQKALAVLIRLPESNRGAVLPSFLAKYDLTRDEKDQIIALAHDPRVAKYGRSMQGVRMESVGEQVRIISKFLPEELLRYVLAEFFEPTAVNVNLHQFTAKFLDFLLSDRSVQNFLVDKVPPFFRALTLFEREQLRFRHELRVEKCPAPADSLFVHGAFRVFSVEYDVLAYLQALVEGADPSTEEELSPEPRAISVLLLAREDIRSCRHFEIDETTQIFLEKLERGVLDPLPASYRQLVDLGLLKPLQ